MALAQQSQAGKESSVKIYLAGPINGCSDSECNDWRTDLKSVPNHEYIDPMRRDYRGKEAENVDEIVKGDIADIDEADLVVANCPKPSYGTAMEIFYAAHVLGKSVWIVCADEKPSPWLLKHSKRIFKRHQEVQAALDEMD
jgi:nucleoside 2-deoxyribosyltransferase